MIKLARRISARQQVLATALVYIKRFYLCVCIFRTNLYLVITTALYLACKTEEVPLHIRAVLAEAVKTFPDIGATDASKVGECEFHMISTLDARLIVFHPYRIARDIGQELDLSREDMIAIGAVMNDSYNTDLHFLYAPHVIAVMAIIMVVVLRNGQQVNQQRAPGSSQGLQAMMTGVSKINDPKVVKVVEWVANSGLDIEDVIRATQDMICLYEVWESYSERVIREMFARSQVGTLV